MNTKFKVLRLKEAADYLNTEEKKLAAAVKNKRVPFFMLNGEIRFTIEDLDKWIYAASYIPSNTKLDRLKERLRNENN